MKERKSMLSITKSMSDKIQICRAIAIIAVVIIHNAPPEIGGGDSEVSG